MGAGVQYRGALTDGEYVRGDHCSWFLGANCSLTPDIFISRDVNTD